MLELTRSKSADERLFTDDKEITLRRVWARVLKVDIESISHRDSFVALGGTSLQAITVVNELRKSGMAIELASLMGSTSLEEVARSSVPVATNVPEDPEPFAMITEVATRQRYENEIGICDAYPVTPLQEGLLASSLGGNSAYIYQRVWDMKGIDVAKLRDAMQIVFERSDILRTTFVPHGKSYLQIIRKDIKLPWKVSSSQLADYKKSAKEAGFAIGGCLFNLTLVRERYLVESIHHSLFDFWSHRFLYQDIAAVYFGKPLVERPPFRRFVKYILDADHSSADKYWKERLGDARRTILNHAPGNEQVTVETSLALDVDKASKALGLTVGKGVLSDSIYPLFCQNITLIEV